jgi:gamma-butyrobetaine dioxygenase
MTLYDEVLDLFGRRGREEYHGEAVTQTEHALQAAAQAAAEGAPDRLIVAALLHDVGHLLDEPEDLAERGIDGCHEDAGASWIEQRFSPEVAEPVRLHVAAKRYLCAVEPPYLASLSSASRLSLSLQGGPFDATEVAAFEANPLYQDAVRLRRWDDAAKSPGLLVPDLATYQARIEALAPQRSRRGA